MQTSNPPCVRQPWEILPQQKWEQLSQEQLLCWVQVAIESYRQNWDLLKTMATWKKLWDFDAHAHLQVDAELINSDTIALTKPQLLELASSLINRAFEKEVDG